MVRNSIAQYQAETGMTMSEEEIEKLRAMGYSQNQCATAVLMADGDENKAVDLLLRAF